MLRRISAVLKAAGGGFENLVQMVEYVTPEGVGFNKYVGHFDSLERAMTSAG